MNRHTTRFLLRRLPALLSLAAALLLPTLSSEAQPRQLNASETELAIKKLNVLASALYIAAHPDDENTAMLAYLSNGALARTAYLSVTRGDGGQNLIGTEQGDMLGVLRTQELLAARRIDGAEQFFTRAIDFGFTKTPEEALRIWGRERTLADVVWVIRRFRPDVVITRFPTSGAGGHGQHTASAILAEEAFAAAADPTKFPEQLRYVGTWKPARLLWNYFGRPPAANTQATAAQANANQPVANRATTNQTTTNQTNASRATTTTSQPTTGQATAATPSDAPRLIGIDLGAYNALLGKSYTELAALSRSMHKSQGFGSAERRGSAVNYLAHVAGEASEREIFESIDTSWRRIAGGARVGALLEEAARDFKPSDPQASLPLLLRAHAELGKLPASDAWVAVKRRELLDVIRACAGLWIEAIAGDFYATPGGELRITATLVNRSAHRFRFESVKLPFDDGTKNVNAELRHNEPTQAEFTIRVPAGADFSQPFWLRSAGEQGAFAVADQTLVGLAENPPSVNATVNIADASGTSGASGGRLLAFEVPVLFRWTDRVRGEQYRPVEIAPAASVNFEEKIYVFPDRQSKAVRLTVRNNSSQSIDGTLRLRLPAGWRATPDAAPFNLKNKSDEFSATFNVAPPSDDSAGTLGAEVHTTGGASGGGDSVRLLQRGWRTIEHAHIPVQTLFPPAETKLVRLELARRGARIGYVMGSGDEIPQSLRQVGYSVVLLSDEDLDNADLSKNFDAIVTGVRAYNTRPRLRLRQPRLLEYVARGGTLVVQYNTPDEASLSNLGPYPFKISRERVTVEEAPVALLLPAHALLQTPNRITAADFDNWIQERGLYFSDNWDARYETPLETHDPGETAKRGGTLVARHGKGTYIYTAYAWFRQLPAGVPGAYRLFVNMIDAGK